MTELEAYKKLVIGKTLTNLYFTKQDGPHDYMPGISAAYYFSTVMELNHQTKLRFGTDFIVEWENDEPLIVLTRENWELPKGLDFNGQKITNLVKDNESDQLTFHLENGTTIEHTMDYGDQLFIENPGFTEYENSNQKITAVLNVKRKWWQKLLGFK